MRIFRLVVAAQVLAGAAWSQDTTTVLPPSPAPAAAVDSTRLIKPLPAFFHSALIPGWGQAKLDRKLTAQINRILHHEEFQQLEGAWRGLHYLVMNTETSAMLKIKTLNVSKRELYKDVDKAVEFDQSQIFKKLYENEFGMPGGEPYGSLIGDYEFTNHPDDISLLNKMSNVAAAAFCPFISAAAPQLFGFKNFPELAAPRDLEKIFDTVEYTAWKSYRESEDSRFVCLTMPRVLSRLPYGANTKPIEEFEYEEVASDSRGRGLPVPHEHYSWMNAAYVMGTRLTDAFAKYGFCVAIRGAEGGGKVEGLPAHIRSLCSHA